MLPIFVDKKFKTVFVTYTYLIRNMRRQRRVMKQRDHEQRSPEEDIRCGNDQEHSHSPHALPLHSGEVPTKTATATQRQVGATTRPALAIG